MRRTYGCPENFRESLSTPTATFAEVFSGLLFRSILWMCVQNLKFTRLQRSQKNICDHKLRPPFISQRIIIHQFNQLELKWRPKVRPWHHLVRYGPWSSVSNVLKLRCVFAEFVKMMLNKWVSCRLLALINAKWFSPVHALFVLPVTESVCQHFSLNSYLVTAV